MKPRRVVECISRPLVVVHLPHASAFTSEEARSDILLDDPNLIAELVAMTDGQHRRKEPLMTRP